MVNYPFKKGGDGFVAGGSGEMVGGGRDKSGWRDKMTNSKEEESPVSWKFARSKM